MRGRVSGARSRRKIYTAVGERDRVCHSENDDFPYIQQTDSTYSWTANCLSQFQGRHLDMSLGRSWGDEGKGKEEKVVVVVVVEREEEEEEEEKEEVVVEQEEEEEEKKEEEEEEDVVVMKDG
ncbi:hypothetical protein Pmani_005735 [Petrolisthes manimaculis]|uniref:Uncharacterized protein n=1 Tax=Petrolisthes manimaculis TaxID=1843537 RepID=A0AAE1QEC9_9EUCA|nr:hypothetical protein Pmani_005735 [Petrolisthes manimaculis]